MIQIQAWLYGHYSNVEALLYTGGDVLLILFGVAFLLWWFIIERMWFFFGPSRHRRDAKRLSDKLELMLAWEARWDTQKALWLRRRWVSESHIRANHGMMAIRGLVQICPLLGLLGTITGMIKAFMVIQQAGGKVDAAALAGGIWEAMLTTALGLAVALPVMMGHSYLVFCVESRESMLKQSIVSYLKETSAP